VARQGDTRDGTTPPGTHAADAPPAGSQPPPPLGTPPGAPPTSPAAAARQGLAGVFFWLLLGDFCLHLMDNGVVPTLVPLQLESLGASKTLYNFVAGTLVNILYCVLVPIVSMWSDRTRTRIGRRRPFLLVTAPLIAIMLVLLGFSSKIGALLHTSLPGVFGDTTVVAVTLGLTVGLFVVFKLLDMFPQSIYYYLWPDVIPPEWLGTFGALFRVFYAGGSLFFNWYLIGLAKTNPALVYCLSAALYLMAFTLLCWRVKEPAYPPPPPVSAEQDATMARKTMALGKSYVRDCFSMPFYWKYFLAMALFQCAYQPFIGNLIFLGKQIYGDTEDGLKRYGSVIGTKDLIWIGIYLALVPIMKKLHPLKAGVLGYALMIVCALAGSLFVHDEQTFRIITIVTFASVGLYLVGTAALPARLLPREKYGQFNSAGAIVFRLSVAIVSTPAGMFFTHFGVRHIFTWLLAFLLLGGACIIMLYLDWKRLGGDKDFVPPT